MILADSKKINKILSVFCLKTLIPGYKVRESIIEFSAKLIWKLKRDPRKNYQRSFYAKRVLEKLGHFFFKSQLTFYCLNPFICLSTPLPSSTHPHVLNVHNNLHLRTDQLIIESISRLFLTSERPYIYSINNSVVSLVIRRNSDDSLIITFSHGIFFRPRKKKSFIFCPHICSLRLFSNIS